MTDDELIGILDVEGRTWIIHAGGGATVSPSSLRLALKRAHLQSEHGAAVTHLTRTPNDGTIDASQLFRLWVRLGWLPT